MEGAPGGEKVYGANISDSRFEYLWSVDVRQSAVARASFAWASRAAVPAHWAADEPTSPSFYLDLDSNSTQAGFEWAASDVVACMRPALEVNGSVVAPQEATITPGSAVVRSRFLHTNDPACRRPLVLAEPQAGS